MSSHHDTPRSTKHVQHLPQLPPRPVDAHKGTFGRVLVLGGSLGMAGAPALVALAAMRSGAGLVTLAVPSVIQPTVAGLCPCATTVALPSTRNGQIDPRASIRVLKDRGLIENGNAGPTPDVLVVGPGAGTGSSSYGSLFWRLINRFRHVAHVPAVIDADALNLSQSSARKPAGPVDNVWDAQPHGRTVITPHPGELARMHGLTTREIQADREGWAVKTARMMRCPHPTGSADGNDAPVVVLKGAGTIVTDGRRIYTNRTGNPGMATGGSGDVLAGILGALIGQGMTCFDAAVLAVYLHGLAGDLAATKLGPISLIATDIIDALPAAFLNVSSRSKRE